MRLFIFVLLFSLSLSAKADTKGICNLKVIDIINFDKIAIQGGMSGSTGAGAMVVANQYNGVIASVNDVQVSSSSVSIGGQSFPREANSTTLVQDKEGNTYGVSETGEKVQVGKQTNEKIPNSGGGYSAGSDPTPLAKDKGSVTFVAHATQKYGFDLLPNPELANNYDKISGISIPWKSVKTAGMDKVSYTGTASTGALKFRTKAGFEYKPENGVLNIIGTKHGDVQEIYAIAYQDSANQHVIGKLQAMTLNPIKNVVYVIPTQANQTVDKAKLKAYLDKVYDQAAMHWEVEVISQYKPTITLGDNGLDIAKDESRKDLSPEMKALRDDYLKQGLAQREDAQTYYVFLVDKFSDASIDGYFPQSKIFGFVRYASSESTLHKTLAHELGHGAGNLEHPFVQYKITQGATPLLMDYSSGTLLSKQDWGMIHNPGIRTGWNDAVGEGQRVSGNIIACDIDNVFDKDKQLLNYKYFLVSSNNGDKWIELDKDITPNQFYVHNNRIYLLSFKDKQGNVFSDNNATENATNQSFVNTDFKTDEYMVQIASLTKKNQNYIDAGFEERTENGQYKYLKKCNNFIEAIEQSKLLQKEYNGAFVVGYSKGKRITIPDMKFKIIEESDKIIQDFKKTNTYANFQVLPSAVIDGKRDIQFYYNNTIYTLKSCKMLIEKVMIGSAKNLNRYGFILDSIQLAYKEKRALRFDDSVCGEILNVLPMYKNGKEANFKIRIICSKETGHKIDRYEVRFNAKNSSYIAFINSKNEEFGGIEVVEYNSNFSQFEYNGYLIEKLFGVFVRKTNKILLYVNGYRPPEGNTNNGLNDKDVYSYWNYALKDQFNERLKPDEIYYFDRSMSVTTSNHVHTLNNYFFQKIFDDVARPTLAFNLTTFQTKLNPTGFQTRISNGEIAGKKLVETMTKMKLNKEKAGLFVDTIDIVCHSMGYAYALGVINELKSLKNIHFGRIYILAPEGACNNNASVTNLGLFEEVWQYGSDYARTQCY